MASSDNLAAIEPWMFGGTTTFGDSWLTGAFARETESVLTRALQKSLFDNLSEPPLISPSVSVTKTADTTVSAASGSGSEPETPVVKRRNNAAAAGGRITKRKSRASKKNLTTFITADPANFRQMVQQVTGVKFGNGQIPLVGAGSVPVVKPEPYRVSSALLPTLDTSAGLLDRRGAAGRPLTVVEGVVGGGGGFDFDSFPSFPTLESWN